MSRIPQASLKTDNTKRVYYYKTQDYRVYFIRLYYYLHLIRAESKPTQTLITHTCTDYEVLIIDIIQIFSVLCLTFLNLILQKQLIACQAQRLIIHDIYDIKSLHLLFTGYHDIWSRRLPFKGYPRP